MEAVDFIAKPILAGVVLTLIFIAAATALIFGRRAVTVWLPQRIKKFTASAIEHKVLFKIMDKNEKYGNFEAEKEALLPINPFPGLLVSLHFNLPNKNELVQEAKVLQVCWLEKPKIIKVVFGHIFSDINTLKDNGWKVYAVIDGVYREV
ncbi:MAG: hypothetical protein WC460_00825 [Patescibacteria group bacterium]